MSLYSVEPIPQQKCTQLQGSYTYFSAVLLSVWDNILGPHVDHVWYGPTADKLQPDIIHYVSSHTLNGEIVRTDFGDKPGDRISAKLFVFSEKRVCVTAFIFRGCAKSGLCLFSLCLIMTLNQLTSYLPLHDLCESKMRSCVPQIIGMQKENRTAIDFSSVIERFVQSIANITRAPLSNVKLQSTAFHDQESAGEMFDLEFLKRCITSHLQTCCCTIVVGEKIEPLNMLISTLALFLSPTERQLSRYAVDVADMPDLVYESDLFLQGLLLKPGQTGHEKVPGSEVVRTKLPSTLINVTSKTVEQTNPSHKHHAMRDDFLTLEHNLMMEPGRRRVAALLSTDINGRAGNHATFPDPNNFYKNVFHETFDHSRLVQDFVNEVFDLPPTCGVREAYISQFVRLLQRKALALIQYVEAESPRLDHPLEPSASHHIIKKLKKALSLEIDGDFKIILATAEKLQPGIYIHLHGDPAAQCKKVQEELEVL